MSGLKEEYREKLIIAIYDNYFGELMDILFEVSDGHNSGDYSNTTKHIKDILNKLDKELSNIK